MIGFSKEQYPTPSTMSNQSSPLTKYYESLIRSLQQMDEGWNGDASRAFGITSCGEQEGVTTVAANVAVAASRLLNASVLLVDANAAKPSVGEAFGANSSGGLRNVLLGDRRVFDCIVPSRVENVSLLLAGTTVGGRNPAYDRTSLDEVISNLKRVFNLVIFDLPPANMLTPCFSMASRLDGVLLVIESERVHAQTAIGVTRQLARHHANTLGIVFNKQQRNTQSTLYPQPYCYGEAT